MAMISSAESRSDETCIELAAEQNVAASDMKHITSSVL